MSAPDDPAALPARRFSEQEVRAILERAAAMQSEGASAGDSRAMTLAEIEQAAAEAGLDRALVRRAAAEVRTPRLQDRTPAKSAFLGAPKRLVVEAVVPGAITESDHAALVGIIQDAMGAMGNLQSMGDSLSWSPQLPNPSGRQLMVTVRNEDGTIHVRAEENLSLLASSYFGGILGGIGGGGLGLVVPVSILLAKAVSTVIVPFLITGWLGGIYMATRHGYRKKVAERQTQLGAMVEALAARCGRPALPPGS